MAGEDKTLSGRSNPSSVQLFVVTILRFAIGWHFLYEGMVKVVQTDWTAAAYLAESKWLFSDVFHWIVANPTAMAIVDFLNVWGLILIGAGLMLGCLTRLSSVAGILLLLLYYLANPAMPDMARGTGAEGNYLIINKNLIEMIALIIVILVPTGKFMGLDGLIADIRHNRRIKKKPLKDPEIIITGDEIPAGAILPRRGLLKHLALTPFLGGFVYAYLKRQGWESYEERHLLSEAGNTVDAVSGATLKTFTYAQLKDLKGPIPFGQIGNLKISRLFLGGNLIGGWAHARDLIYVSKLVKSYHSDQKVFDTFRLAEQCGINTILTNPQLARVINKYWRQEKGKIQFISDCGYKGDAIEGVKVSIDGGAHACYVQGQIADDLAAQGKMDIIGKALELTRKNGLPAGIGAHQLETVKACVDYGLKPDFWVKTLHHINYWSSNKDDQHDNIWCVNPKETIDYMNNLPEPWIAFKTLAAGAIHPQEGFSYAFQNGADFICVGMYDFQIVEDTNIAYEVLNGEINRNRPWRA
ncbi:MAG: DoxX family membrane protein [Sedimentisphaerales bacterium]|nr:DoxX family membrane protein [Sedimentisphaerales bacterium]